MTPADAAILKSILYETEGKMLADLLHENHQLAPGEPSLVKTLSTGRMCKTKENRHRDTGFAKWEKPQAQQSNREIRLSTVPRWTSASRRAFEVKKYEYREHPHIHTRIFQRDRGVCLKCGLSTLELSVAIFYVKNKLKDPASSWSLAQSEFCWEAAFFSFKRILGRRASRWPGLLWEIDRIIPKEQGGTDDFDNLRTLCLECHHVETNRLIYQKRRRA